MLNRGTSVEDYTYLLGFKHNDEPSEYLRSQALTARERRRNRGYSNQHQTVFTMEQVKQAAFRYILKPLREKNSSAVLKDPTSSLQKANSVCSAKSA